MQSGGAGAVHLPSEWPEMPDLTEDTSSLLVMKDGLSMPRIWACLLRRKGFELDGLEARGLEWDMIGEKERKEAGWRS